MGDINQKLKEIIEAVEKTGVVVKHVAMSADCHAVPLIGTVLPKVLDVTLNVTLELKLEVNEK
jgi:hypothetical protein